MKTTRQATRMLALTLMAGTLAGCSGMGNLGGLGGSSAPAPLTPAPTTPVQQGGLAPLVVTPNAAPPPAQAGQIVVTQPTTPPVDPNAPPVPGAKPADGAASAVADAKPAPAGDSVEVKRTDLLGGWRLASGADGCQLSMALTQWSGGYRASTRGCASPELQKIAAWSLSGRTVTLIGNDGTTVATLSASSKERFSGSTSGGKGILFSR